MIDYKLLAESQEFYEDRGFEVMETPWTVTKEISDATGAEHDNWTIKEKGKVLVASAEQGFLYLMNKGFLSDGYYQSISPCFRSDSFSWTHTKYFMKNELIKIGDTNLKNLINPALDFFRKIGLEEAEIKETSEGSDIVFRGIELGSYGKRKFKDLQWVFGTAIAEPRTSRVLKWATT